MYNFFMFYQFIWYKTKLFEVLNNFFKWLQLSLTNMGFNLVCFFFFKVNSSPNMGLEFDNNIKSHTLYWISQPEAIGPQ